MLNRTPRSHVLCGMRSDRWLAHGARMHLRPSVSPSLRFLLVASALALPFSAPRAHAQDGVLAIDVVGGPSWAETVAALEHDVGAQGRRLSLRVVDRHGQVAPCGYYALTFDEAGSRAFSVGACDPATSATEVTLVSRTDLFSHEGVVPTPRTIRLTATEVRRGDESGGAAQTGGAALDCSVGVRPYLDDLEHGTVVYLQRDRFDVRPADTSITVEAWSDGWSLRGRARAELTIAYDVVERTTGAVVLHSQATLVCTDAPSTTGGVVTPHHETTIEERTERVLVTSGDDPGRAAEVIAVVDVSGAQASGAEGLWLLRRRAAELHADAVVGVELHRGTRRGPARLSGLAVRYLEH